jgi:hypothetical protein
MGFGDLKGRGSKKNTDALAESFIAGAEARANPERATAGRTRVKNRQSYLFSLSTDVSEQVDQLSLLHRRRRVSRSDVIRVAVQALAELPEEQVLALIDRHLGEP